MDAVKVVTWVRLKTNTHKRFIETEGESITHVWIDFACIPVGDEEITDSEIKRIKKNFILALTLADTVLFLPNGNVELEKWDEVLPCPIQSIC